MKFNKGFTLIEILVVVAIIAILAGVVLASLGNAKGKGDDTAIAATLANTRSQAELYYSNSGNYGSGAPNPTGSYAFCTAGANTNVFNSSPTGLINALKAVAKSNGATLGTDKISCASVANASSNWTAWAVMASTSKSNWCVDSSGQSKAEVPGVGGIANGRCI